MLHDASVRPACVVDIAELPGEKRPRFTSTPGVAAIVRSPSDAAGLTRMGVHVRAVEPGFAGTNRHFHSVEEEWAFVLAGRATLRLGRWSIAVRPGHFAGFPPGPRPHHFVNDGDETLMLLEGGERRPQEDACWYPDARLLSRGRAAVPYEEPPPEEGAQSQVLHVDEAETTAFQHDVDPSVRRRMRTLHAGTGLVRQAVRLAEVAAGGHTTVYHMHERTDEWVFVLAGRARARVGAAEFDVGPNDFIGHPAGGAPHMMHALQDLQYLVGGQIDPADVVVYPEARLRRVAGRLEPLRG